MAQANENQDRAEARRELLLRLAHRRRLAGDARQARALFAEARCEAWRTDHRDLDLTEDVRSLAAHELIAGAGR